MSLEENKAIVRRLVEEGLNVWNFDVIDELIDANFVNHSPAYGVTTGLEGLKQYLRIMRSAFPDIKATIDDLIAENDKVVVRMTGVGIHKGELAGIPATGKQVKIEQIGIFRLVGGKVVERWVISDRLSTMEQIGVIPSQ